MESNYQPFGSGTSGNEGATSSDAGNPITADFLTLNSGGNTSGDGGGSGGNDGERFDPAIHVSPDKRNKDGSFTRKRGRKSSSASGGNRNSNRQKDNSTNIESLTTLLAIVHAGLASATKTPELALDLDDSEALANATANVLIEFDIQPNPKVQAVVGLVMTAGGIYGPKIYMIRERKKEERKDKENG